MFEAVDHLGVAVEDLDTAIELYSERFGMPLQHRETVSEQGVEAVLLGVGDSHVELLRPLGDDTPIGRFLAKRGPGLHHTAYRCVDVAEALEQCRAQGLRLIDTQPRRGIRDSQVAFLHPASTGGVLTELVQPAEEVH
jgi:methylmalonyl-CoA/ethylmalonyl-CoA epimerase